VHFAGSGLAAMINFPLWKAAAIGQSGFKEAADFSGRMRLIFGPPYKGVAATIFGMTWARATIFYGSDVGKDYLLERGFSGPVASTLPPLGLAAFVQVANQPIVRSTIMLQDPSSTQPNVLSQLAELLRTRGWRVRARAAVLRPQPLCSVCTRRLPLRPSVQLLSARAVRLCACRAVRCTCRPRLCLSASWALSLTAWAHHACARLVARPFAGALSRLVGVGAQDGAQIRVRDLGQGLRGRAAAAAHCGGGHQ
jgi:hypothetical protein